MNRRPASDAMAAASFHSKGIVPSASSSFRGTFVGLLRTHDGYSTGLRGKHERRAFLGSTFLLSSLLMTGAAVLFPMLLFSTNDPADRLTAFDCAAPVHSLWIATAWWFTALALALTYLFVIQRYYSGKVNVSTDNQGLY